MAGKPTVGKVRKLKTKEQKEREERERKRKAAEKAKKTGGAKLPRGMNKHTRELLIRSRKGE